MKRCRSATARLLRGALAVLSTDAWAAPLTLPEVLGHVDEDPHVRLALAALDEASGDRVEARAVDNPQLRLSVRDVTNAEGMAVQAGVRLPVPNPFTLAPTREAATHRETSAALSLAQARADARQRLVLAYVEAVTAADVTTAHEHLVERHAELVVLLEARRAVGSSDALALAHARAALARAGSDATLARTEASHALEQLAQQIGWSGAAPDLAPAPEPVVPPSLDEALSRALAGDFELRARMAERRADELTSTSAHRVSVPWLDWVQPALRVQPDGLRLDVSTAIRLPAWNWGLGLARAATARVAAADAQVELRAAEVRAAVTEAWFRRAGALARTLELQAGVASIRADIQHTDASLRPAMAVEEAGVALDAVRAEGEALVATYVLDGWVAP